jgi:hypothetical protein
MRCLAIVRFPAPAGLTGARLRAVLEDAVPRYQGIPGLHRKYFLGNESSGGGVYEWDSRERAEAFYNDAWRERLRTVYGATPTVEYFDVHAVVDNESGTSRIDA